MFKDLKVWREERGLENKVGNIEGNIAEELTELIRANSDEDKIDALCDLIVFSVNAIEAMGFNAETCMDETIKEISSRTGSYNPTSQKWEKFKTPEARALWYEADYGKCKTVNHLFDFNKINIAKFMKIFK